MKKLPLLLCALVCLLLQFGASAQVPVLNSYPAAGPVVLLDFDGHLVEGTSWNSNGAFYCDNANMNSAQILTVFNRVAEDFRPFNVNVTTDSLVYAAAPATQRTRVVLTTSSSWYGVAGGVAFIGSFTWGDNTPCFVFTALHNYNVKNISEAASHEAGHTLGLRHQSSYDGVCNKTAEYNAGVGSGEISWAPIMGVGYYRNVTLWHYGANPYGCTSYQDDLAVITDAANGTGFRPDDHAEVLPLATAASFTNNEFTVGGIIEQPTDVDAVRFTTQTPGRLRLDATPFNTASGNAGSNIDLEVELLNNAFIVLGTYNPSATLNAIIDTQLNAGTYYLRVRGKGNIYAPNYASLGSYTLQGRITAGNPLPVHKLELKGVTVNTRHQLSWDIIADEQVVEQTVEVSGNGTHFSAASSVGNTTRQHSAAPQNNPLHYYRIKVLFDNGKLYYSNTVVLRKSGGHGKPYLVSNQTGGDQIQVSSPAPFRYTLTDMSGRTLGRGQVSQGVNYLSTGQLSSGIYLIQFNNGEEYYTEKLFKH